MKAKRIRYAILVFLSVLMLLYSGSKEFISGIVYALIMGTYWLKELADLEFKIIDNEKNDEKKIG
jgi:hypothetical protein